MDDEKKDLEKPEEKETKPKAKKDDEDVKEKDEAVKPEKKTEEKEESKKAEEKTETKEKASKVEEKKEPKKEKEVSKTKTKKEESESKFEVVKPKEMEIKFRKSEPKKENETEEKSNKTAKKAVKKNHMGWKIFGIIILLVILVAVYYSLRNSIIYAKILANASNYTNSQNYKLESKITGNNTNTTRTIYYLKGKYKIVISPKANDTLTVLTMQNKMALFYNVNGEKKVQFTDHNMLIGALGIEFCTLKPSYWYDVLLTKIENDDENNYVITSLKPDYTATINNEDEKIKTKCYVDKDTGLITKTEEIKPDGSIYKTTTYAYDFNNVTQSDLSMPDIASYTIAD